MESLDAFRDQPLSSGAPQDVQSMREKLDEAWAALLGVSDEAAAIVEYERGQQRAWANRDGAFDHHFPPTVADPVTDRGRMWWAHSEWSTAQSPIELFGFWDNDASGVKFVGQIVWDDGDLLSGVVARARGIFGLGSDRLPPAGQYFSRPTASLVGDVAGATGGSPFIGLTDQWSKCWLTVSQTVFNAAGQKLATASEPRELFFLDGRFSDQVVPLPGTIAFPMTSFSIKPGDAISIVLEIAFSIQLEGDHALFRFGNWGGSVPAFFHTPQWMLDSA
jgi:hypothetical protein